MKDKNVYFLLLFLFGAFGISKAQGPINASITIDTKNGHSLQEGSSGFNVRIADKVWSYTHPDFREAVHSLKPGWLRFFSGTAGDAFSSATGLYDKDYAWMFDHSEEYMKLYAFTDVKGPHRISDLYNLLGEVGGKLIVTINGFTETPEVTAELARFCKNNNIEVEAWQFCNEPYFYIPGRQRYWWNDGYDYASKMKPHADSILKVFPDAKLALNYSWDGIWEFTKEINKYQIEHGAYWNVFSKHSYAPHIGGDESFESAYGRGNTKLLEVTSEQAMKDIEGYSWQGIPMVITEFGVWNKVLNGIYTGIYNAEYTLRQLAHPNALYIGSHEISNKYQPATNLNKKITDAYEKGIKINTDNLLTGIKKSDEGKAMEILHEATSSSDYTWHASVNGGAQVPGMKNTTVEGVYARAFKGLNGFDYLAITNRSNSHHNFNIQFGDQQLNTKFYRKYMWSAEAEGKSDIPITIDTVSGGVINVPPFSVMLLKWSSSSKSPPASPRIYKSEVKSNGLALTWWKRENADQYIVKYGTSPSLLNTQKTISGAEMNSVEIMGLNKGNYFFAVQAINKNGKSPLSELVKISYNNPNSPQIFKTARRDTTITVFWRSVPNVNGYYVNVVSANGNFKRTYDAKNTFGFRIDGLEYDVPYQVTVEAYNGLGKGAASAPVTITCKKNIPIPPRNISARETELGIALDWVAQDTIHKNTKYRLYRGTELHKFSVLADNISGNSYIDKSTGGKEYYYTVKSYTEDGECSFYPNIATIIRVNRKTSVVVQSIAKMKDHFLVKVVFANIPLDGETLFGISLNDISYLNGEENKIVSSEHMKNSFDIKVPFSAVKAGRSYAVKGFVQTNGGTPIVSMPPFKIFSLSN
ncbi:MAG: fibronectin type III domain-containing protein [Daejeonella sp.]